jgi:hypothetical protein
MGNLPETIQYPTVQIGDKTFTVKFRGCDIVRIKNETQIDLLEQNAVQLTGADGIEKLLKIFSHAVAHQEQVTAEWLSENADLAQLHEMGAAITSALIKARAQATPAIMSAIAEMKRVAETAAKAMGLEVQPPVPDSGTKPGPLQ